MRLALTLAAWGLAACTATGPLPSSAGDGGAPDLAGSSAPDGHAPDGAPPQDGAPVAEVGPPLDGGAGSDGGGPDLGDGLDAGPTDADPTDAGPPDLGDDGPPALQVVALGPQPLRTPLTVRLEAPADGLLIQARGPAEAILGVVDVRGPDGPLVGHSGLEGPSRAVPNPGVATALLPNDGSGPLPAGEYRFTVTAIGADVADTAEVEIWISRGAGAHLRVNVWVPPALGIALDDPALDLFAAALRGRVAALGVDAVSVAVQGLPAETDPVVRMNGLRRDFSGLSALAAQRPLDTPPGVEVYLVEDILDGEQRINGFAAGLPAPLGWPDTAASVVAVRGVLLPDFPAAVADFAQHEIGHALGLFHTTEPFGDRHDPLDDTLPCPLACDADGDGVLFARECGAQGQGSPPCQGASDNVMFWTLGGQRGVSAQQRAVTRRHPLAGLPP